MTAEQTRAVSDRCAVIIPMAVLLQKLEMSNVPVDADQYRSVVNRLAQLLADTPLNEALNRVLHACPAAAELYENQQYRHAGLCRSPLDPAIEAERAARTLLEGFSLRA